MSFLPIVQRELQVAARRKATFRMRLWTALIASLVAIGFLFASFIGAVEGKVLLIILSTYTAVLCLFLPLFLTSDCISEEKREGTIGLLFLTELHSYDFVLGKFIARSLNAFYGLIALLPVMAISLLFGGLTGAEFWRIALALVNTLFVSLAAGIFVSASSRSARNTMACTFVVLLGSIFLHVGIFFFAYETNYVRDPSWYWRTLAGTNVAAWILLGLASFVVARTWQYKTIEPRRESGFAKLLPFRARRVKRRKSLLNENPVLWLIGDDPGVRSLAWFIVICWAAIVTVATVTESATLPWAYQGAKAAAFLLKILVASVACRFFAEARRNGMLELLLCTPLSSLELLRGQWLALQRIFLWPLIVFVLFYFLPASMALFRGLGGSGLPPILAELMGIGGGFFALAALAIYFLADVYAICWFGTWLSLASKKPERAALWTVLFVVLLPSIFCFLDIIADLFFILWAVIKLHQDFRSLLGQQFESRPGAVAMKPPPVLRAGLVAPQ